MSTQGSDEQSKFPNGRYQPTNPQPVPYLMPVPEPLRYTTERPPCPLPTASHICRGAAARPCTYNVPTDPGPLPPPTVKCATAQPRIPHPRAHLTQPKVKQRSPHTITRALLQRKWETKPANARAGSRVPRSERRQRQREMSSRPVGRVAERSRSRHQSASAKHRLKKRPLRY